ncbi:Uncharacterised protein [Lachnospira pectinoschiza]|nr:Uncharacterised protein [Lachnospira pectinoschiza]
MTYDFMNIENSGLKPEENPSGFYFQMMMPGTA